MQKRQQEQKSFVWNIITKYLNQSRQSTQVDLFIIKAKKIQENVEAVTRLHSPRDEARAQSRHSNNHQRSDSYQDSVESRQQHDRVESRQESRTESRHDRTHSRISQVSPRDGGEMSSRLSPLKEPDPPARRPYVHTQV